MAKRSALLFCVVATLVVGLAYGVLSACDGDSCDSTECLASCGEQGYPNGVCYGSDCECLGEADGDADSDASMDGGDAEAEAGDAEADGPVVPPDPCELAGHPCTPPAGCVNVMCVDPVADKPGYATAAGSRPSSFWWTIQIPALFTDPEGEPVVEECCIDLVDGDGVVGNTDGVMDNSFGTLISMMGSGMMGGEGGSPQDSVDAAIEAGTMSWLCDWLELPDGDGPARFSIFGATSEDDWATRAAGTGDFYLDSRSFGDYGALFQFNQATITGGQLSAGPSTFGLALPLSTDGSLVEVAIHGARIEAPIEVTAEGVATIDETRPEGSIPAIVGGGRLGGFISAGDLLGGLDDTFRQCSCAGISPASPVISWGPNEDGDGMEIVCTENSGDGGESCTGDDGLCGGLGQLCDMIGIIAAFFDADLDGDGAKDSISIGLRFGWTGAHVAGLGS